MRRQAKKFAKDGSVGSALILTVVLTSLLAIVGVLFLMMARVNRITASSISKNKELDSAVETVIAKISNELVLDVPGVAGAEYYDYPGPEDRWLASLEPYEKTTGNYYWRQISDVYEKLGPNLELVAKIIPDHQDSSDVNEGKPADADGDGVADSKWVELADMTSSKGKPVYAAIRIVDNGGMLNVNTAYKFDPTDPNAQRIDGSSQMQINLMGLSERDHTHTPQQKIDSLLSLRAGSAPNDVSSYEQNVVWRYGSPNGAYTPFDISDELKLRNRYILNYNLMTSRIEGLWTNAYDGEPYVPRTTPSQLTDPCDWFWKTNNSSTDVNQYDYRHISTTYNMDRIIDPNDKKMVNVNRINDINDINSLYSALLKGLDPCLVDADKVAAQIAVNLKDYIDSDSDVTSFIPDVNSPAYYGFERPCIYISELAHRFLRDTEDTNKVYKSYAIELYKPYTTEEGDPDPNIDPNPNNNWYLRVDGIGKTPIDWSKGSKHFYVMRFEDPCTPLPVTFALDPNYGRIPVDANYHFDAGNTISLLRPVYDVNGVYLCHIVVDSRIVPGPNATTGWLDDGFADGIARSIQRDITPPSHKCIRRLWVGAAEANSTLGTYNDYQSGDPNVIQAHPANAPFTNVGEIGMILTKSAYFRGPNPVGPNDTEATVRIDFTKPEFRQIFKYLTVIDPYNFHPGDANYVNETRIKGRININTAPWFVLAQLPWMQYEDSNATSRAKAISDYRDSPSQQGFWNIGELMLVGRMQDLGADGKDNWNIDTPKGPDFTNDTARDDFEERDLIFSRISNLVTVRSDVFTAYILVRIGTDGPQKRIIAIFDRSNVYSSDDGRMRVLAVQPVADPR